MYLIQILLVTSAFLALRAEDSSAGGISEADILKTVFYGSEDALRDTLEDIEVGYDPSADQDIQEALTAGTWPGGQHFPRDRRMGYICDHLAQAPTSETVQSIQYKMKRIQNPDIRRNVMTALERKKAEMKDCCSKSPSERYQCMDQARQSRYDRICTGETACPWAYLKGRNPNVNKVTQKCCALEGMARYGCFLSSRLDQGCYRRPR